MDRYAIYEENMDRLRKKLNAISAKCTKYGCDFKFNEVGEEFRNCEDENGKPITVRYVIVEAEGIARMNGWRFAATLEHTDKGNIIKKVDDALEVPERYYDCPAVCEHCGTKRSRRDTYIVFNEETGEFKQVGKRCLCDFTNGLSAEAIAKYLSFFDELVKGEEPYSGTYGPRYYSTETMLKYCAETVRKFGYARASDPGSTRDKTLMFYRVREMGWSVGEKIRQDYEAKMERVGYDPDSDEVTKTVTEALTWLNEQEAIGNYMHNLKTVCAAEFVTGRNLGILCSLIPTWNREVEKIERVQKKAEMDAQSEYVGEVGKRITVRVAGSTCVTSWETIYGMTYVQKFTDEAGNVLIWKTSKWLDSEKKIIGLTGTVKGHGEYCGVKQTELTRCKVLYEEKKQDEHIDDGTFELSVLDSMYSA